MFRRLLIPIPFVLIGCLDSEQIINLESVQAELTLYDTFNLPLDTASIISLLDIKATDQISDLQQYTDILDTIELVNVNFACDCQDWVTEEYWNDQDLGKFGYFIEPFNKEIELNENIGAFNNRIRLIGTSYFDNERNLNTKLSDTIRVFTYYAYEILFPSNVYGPLYHTGKTELPNGTEELIQRSIITVKN